MQCNQPRKQKSPVQTLQRLYRPDSWSANCTRYRADLTLWHRNGWLGHLGINKTKERLLLEYYWPGCFKDVENYVRSCDACRRVEKPGDKCKTPLKLVPLISVVPTTGNQHSGAFAAEQRRCKYLSTMTYLSVFLSRHVTGCTHTFSPLRCEH